jgi:microcin C transport system permease protein
LITYYIRGEFYREKSRDYVTAAVAMGASNSKIIFKHILPNSLTPIISFLPFAIVGNISALVALDYLGFGLPPPTPSWGQLIQQGMENISNWWLVAFPLGAQFVTLILIVFIGEAAREAFDPKVYSRLR